MDHRQIDRVQDDDGVILHAKGGGGVDPVAVPARCTQVGVHLCGVVATQRGNDDVALLQRCNVVRVFQRGFVLCPYILQIL